MDNEIISLGATYLGGLTLRNYLFKSSVMQPYQKWYERHARLHQDSSAIGGGEFTLVGELMLSALCLAGLEPHHSLLDFGCGIGRLALQAIPYLEQGRYHGVDISETMLARARRHCVSLQGAHADWTMVDEPNFRALGKNTFDLIGAFSVFTHLEPEDALLYLTGFHRLLRADGSLIVSLLLLEENPTAKQVLRDNANIPLKKRYQAVRNIVCTRDFFETIAAMADWRVERWVRHDEPAFQSSRGDLHGLGQAVCFLKPKKFHA